MKIINKNSLGYMTGLLMLSACGGSGGAGQNGTPGQQLAAVTTGSLQAATVTTLNGSVIPSSIRVSGVNKPVLQAFAGSNIYSDGDNLYRVATGADGESYAISGMTFTGQPTGAIVATATPAPISGSALYTGQYNAEVTGPRLAVPYSVVGNMTIGINFTNDSFGATITDRRTDFAVSGVNNAQLQQNISIAGTVDGNGVLRGTQSGTGNSGTLFGGAFATGAIGTTNIIHDDASGVNRDVFENGVFAVD